MYPQEFPLAGIFRLHSRALDPAVIICALKLSKAKKTMNQQNTSNKPNTIQIPMRYFYVPRKWTMQHKAASHHVMAPTPFASSAAGLLVREEAAKTVFILVGEKRLTGRRQKGKVWDELGGNNILPLDVFNGC